MNDYYTYAWLREDGTPYYVGKGRGRRAFLKRRPYCPLDDNRVLILKKGLTEDEAFRHEIYMIFVLGRKINGGILHNHTDGGDGRSGSVVSQETRDKMSKTRKGKPLAWGPNRPRTLSKDLCKRMGDSRRGRKEPKAPCPQCGRLLAKQHINRHLRGSKCQKSM